MVINTSGILSGSRQLAADALKDYRGTKHRYTVSRTPAGRIALSNYYPMALRKRRLAFQRGERGRGHSDSVLNVMLEQEYKGIAL